MGVIGQQYLEIKDKTEAACVRGGKNPGKCTLIAVSKTKPVELLEDAYAAGARDFGENKVQEMYEKAQILPSDIRWHMIGHLQRNKVKKAVETAFMIHSVDSERLAREISSECVKQHKEMAILIEVNVADEESKFGVSVKDAEKLIRTIAPLPGIRIKGLMTIAPYVTQSEENRVIFQTLRKLSVDIAAKNIDNVSMDFLSMGMTGDYEVAAEEGASYVRVGTGIFGERHYENN